MVSESFKCPSCGLVQFVEAEQGCGRCGAPSATAPTLLAQPASSFGGPPAGPGPQAPGFGGPPAPKKGLAGWLVGVIVGGAVVVVSGTCCVGFGLYQASQEIGSTAVVAGTDGVAEVTRPAGWVHTPGLNEEATIQIASPMRELYLVVLSESKVDFASGTTMDWYSTLTRDHMAQTGTIRHQSGPTRLIVGGYDAVQWEIHATVDMLNVVFLHTVVDTPGHFHQVLGWTLESRFEGGRGELQSTIESFRLRQ